MTTIQNNLTKVIEHITAIADKCGRDRKEIGLLAVSKTKPVTAIQEAIDAGQLRFGENYVQEGVEKIAHYSQTPFADRLEWHFIGPLQSNKTRLVAENFDWIHTVDREKIAQRLNEQRPPSLPPLNALIQINIDDEATKSGIPPEELFALAEKVSRLPNLMLRGVMVIPAPESEPVKQRKVFKRVEVLYLQLKQRYDTVDTLSMGMSDDMASAVEAGSTLLRIGSAVFGSRNTA